MWGLREGALTPRRRECLSYTSGEGGHRSQRIKYQHRLPGRCPHAMPPKIPAAPFCGKREWYTPLTDTRDSLWIRPQTVRSVRKRSFNKSLKSCVLDGHRRVIIYCIAYSIYSIDNPVWTRRQVVRFPETHIWEQFYLFDSHGIR